jgi:hypothetical protein
MLRALAVLIGTVLALGGVILGWFEHAEFIEQHVMPAARQHLWLGGLLYATGFFAISFGARLLTIGVPAAIVILVATYWISILRKSDTMSMPGMLVAFSLVVCALAVYCINEIRTARPDANSVTTLQWVGIAVYVGLGWLLTRRSDPSF